MRDTTAQMSHGSLCQKLMGIKLSKMGVLNIDLDLSSNWTHLHNTDIKVLPVLSAYNL